MASLVTRTLQWFGFARDAEMPEGLQPPKRYSANQIVTPTNAMTLSTVYRAVSIHATAACQLSMGVWRGGEQLQRTPSIVEKPCISMSRSAFYEYTITSLYLTGDAFWKTTRADMSARRPGEVVDLEPINPAEVGVRRDLETHKVSYHYRGTEYNDREIIHLKLLRVGDMVRGLGPIQAAQIEITGALDARDYGAMWFSDTNQPDGVLTTDQELKPGDADTYKNVWYGRNPDGSERTDGTKRNAERLRVLGKGLSYSPLMLKPSDLQFLDSQKFSTTQIARLMGTPASLMLAAIEGDSQTYSNVEQDWIAYARFTLMKPLREIEEALTALLPYGQTARFKIETLLRTDTKTRYEGHKIALDPITGWMTEDEVRGIEGLAPLTPAQRELRAERKQTTTEQEPANV